jgi:kynureninase
MAHEHPFDFAPGAITYAPDARRFLHGTPAIPALCAAEAGYEVVDTIGVEAIRAKSVRQVQLLIDLARDRGLRPRVPDAPGERGGMVVLDGPDAEAVTRELLRREVIVDFRPGAGIRLSPHFYTTDEELSRAVAEIRAILDSGAHRRQARAGSTGF